MSNQTHTFFCARCNHAYEYSELVNALEIDWSEIEGPPYGRPKYPGELVCTGYEAASSCCAICGNKFEIYYTAEVSNFCEDTEYGISCEELPDNVIITNIPEQSELLDLEQYIKDNIKDICGKGVGLSTKMKLIHVLTNMVEDDMNKMLLANAPNILI